MLLLLIGLLINLHAQASVSIEASKDASFQRDIDSAFQEIMHTRVGKAICHDILGARADTIQFHLGVSPAAAATIAQGCADSGPDSWVFSTSYQDIYKLTFQPFTGRKYTLLQSETGFPIESWTDPFTNTTVLLTGNEGISHERLVQLLSHETAVYFDAKANPAHPDARNIPALRDLHFPQDRLNPLVALSDPFVAHTLTYLRALQVEFAIVDELVATRKIVAPADRNNTYLAFLISDQCRSSCLMTLVATMRPRYAPVGLPLLAFAPNFRALLPLELQRLQPNWSPEQWARLQSTLRSTVGFLKTEFQGRPLEDLQRVFVMDEQSQRAVPEFQRFLNDDLWPLERFSILHSQASPSQSLLEFMKVPLLSGYNIRLSSGPRVRIRTGNIE